MWNRRVAYEEHTLCENIAERALLQIYTVCMRTVRMKIDGKRRLLPYTLPLLIHVCVSIHRPRSILERSLTSVRHREGECILRDFICRSDASIASTRPRDW